MHPLKCQLLSLQIETFQSDQICRSQCTEVIQHLRQLFPGAFTKLRLSIKRFKRKTRAVFENDFRPGHPIRDFPMNQVAHNIVWAPGVRAFRRRCPGSWQITQLLIQHFRCAAEYRDALVEEFFAHASIYYLETPSSNSTSAILEMPFFLAFALLFMTQTTAETAPRRLLDVEYAQIGGISLRFDASIPASAAPSPAVIIVHGGGWVRGDRRTNVEPLFKPLSDAGIAWFSISYTLAGNPFQVGTAVSDVEAAIQYIHSHAAKYNIDPDRIALIGESAGGQLASMAALGASVGSRVKAVVAIYTPTDMVALARNSDLIPAEIRNQLNGTPWERLILSRLAQLSPQSAIRKGMPPFLLIHGDKDKVVPIEQSRLMCKSMLAIGAGCKLVTVPGGGHGIRGWEPFPERSEPYKRELVQWLKLQLLAA